MIEAPREKAIDARVSVEAFATRDAESRISAIKTYAVD